MFESVSFHIVKPCNFSCKFCYATFADMGVRGQLSLEDAISIISKLRVAGMQKITFAGGEPLLYNRLDDAIKYSKSIGLTTSVITNGSLLTADWMENIRPHLDWVGISIDSLSDETNIKIGRFGRNPLDYYDLIKSIYKFGYKLKINTVVNKYNWNEDMNDFISWAAPDRWKIFQALRVLGQNDAQWDEIKVNANKFEYFLMMHADQTSAVPENNEAMTGSYLLIDPIGRLFENSAGLHTYSEPLKNSTVEKCLSQINLNREMFIKRGGIYKW